VAKIDVQQDVHYSKHAQHFWRQKFCCCETVSHRTAGPQRQRV